MTASVKDDAAEPRLKILLTEGSSMTVRELLFALGPRHTIDLLDPSSTCQGRFSRFVRKWHRCPPYAKQPLEYLAELGRRLDEGDYDVLLPTHEMVYLLAKIRDEIAADVAIALPTFDAIHQVQGKVEFVRLMQQLELPIPETRIVQSTEELLTQRDFPCYVKLAYSTAGSGVWKVDCREDLEALAGELHEQGAAGVDELIVQAPCEGDQGVFYGIFQNGRMVAEHCIELQRTGAEGWAMSGISADHPAVREHIQRLGAHLNWHGAMFLDYFYDRQSQKPLYLECNARINAAYHALLSGVDLAGQLVNVSLGKQIEPLPPGKPGVRFHQSFLMLMSRALEGVSRRELWREWRSIKAGRGFYAGSEDTVSRCRDDWWSTVPSRAVAAMLLVNPTNARKLVDKTVSNYALPAEAARAIQEIPKEELLKSYRQHQRSMSA